MIFSWLRRKQEERFFVDLMRAAAEGDKIARLRQAFSTLSPDLANEKENHIIAAKAAAILLKEISTEKSATIETSAYDFIDGIFILVFTNHFSLILRESFEITSLIGFLERFGATKGAALIPGITEQYNELSLHSSSFIQDIGEACAGWVIRPDIASLGKLHDMYNVSIMKTK